MASPVFLADIAELAALLLIPTPSVESFRLLNPTLCW